MIEKEEAHKNSAWRLVLMVCIAQTQVQIGQLLTPGRPLIKRRRRLARGPEQLEQLRAGSGR